MENKRKILIICQHNSGRSQIAQAYLQAMAGEDFVIESAGLEPAQAVNPLVVEVMQEEGFDLSHNKPQSVFERFKAGRLYEHVITVCHDSEDLCPIFPGITKRWHCPFPDPAQAEGTEAEKLARVRGIRDQIKDWLRNPQGETFSLQALVQP